MPEQPPPWWLDFVRGLDDLRDDMLARIAEVKEVASANYEWRDDYERQIGAAVDLFKVEVARQLQHIGRNAEEALKRHDLHDFQHVRRHEVESMRQAIDGHAKQHEEGRKAATAFTIAQLDNRTKIVLALIGLAQFVAGLLVGSAPKP